MTDCVDIQYDGKSYCMEPAYNTDHIAKVWAGGWFYEMDVLRQVKKLDLAGTYIDVGSNIGNHSVYFSNLPGCKMLYSIEASADLAAVTAINLERNSVSPFSVINLPLSDKPKKVQVSEVDPNNTGLTYVIAAEDGDKTSATLDELFPLADDVVLIKVDVEGMEFDVLCGGAELIDRCRPVIITEINDDAEYDQIYDFLTTKRNYVRDGTVYGKTPTFFWASGE